MQLFVCENCKLTVRLNRFFTSPPAGVAEQLPPELTSEWNEFFVEGIYNLLLPLLTKIPSEFDGLRDHIVKIKMDVYMSFFPFS